MLVAGFLLSDAGFLLLVLSFFKQRETRIEKLGSKYILGHLGGIAKDNVKIITCQLMVDGSLKLFRIKTSYRQRFLRKKIRDAFYPSPFGVNQNNRCCLAIFLQFLLITQIFRVVCETGQMNLMPF